ncbi:MAG: ribbon-helix-helix protein, CopG family [Clostridia bacterium]|nr:ribbon-helix-helix protein, CopG family [Clostridia bacterium]
MVYIASIGIRLLPQEKEILTAIAKRKDTTISQIMRKLIRDYISYSGQSSAEKENHYEHQPNESILHQTSDGNASNSQQ